MVAIGFTNNALSLLMVCSMVMYFFSQHTFRLIRLMVPIASMFESDAVGQVAGFVLRV